MNFLLNAIQAFYQKNLFERVIIYLFLSALLVKVIFELILGQWSFVQAQNRQWFFYGFLAVDYLLSTKKIINFRVTLNLMSLYAVILFIMIAQGLYVGITNNNKTFEVINDTIPLLMIALNIIRFQSYSESKPIDFIYLLKACTIISIGTCFIGFLAQSLGKPSTPTVGNGTIYLPLLLSALFTLRPFPKWTALAGLAMIALSLPDMNRTTLAFFGLVIGGYTTYTLVKKPAYGAAAGVVFIMLLSIGWVSLPEDSQAYKRIVGLQNINLDARTGSVGERQAEMDAVQAKLDFLGPVSQWLGLGFGGTYEVQFTHKYLKDYGHAHFSWVWFNLRFGRLGYLYLSIMVIMLTSNAIIQFRNKSSNGVFVGLLCLNSLIYCITYVNAIFLISGVQFLYDTKKQTDDK